MAGAILPTHYARVPTNEIEETQNEIQVGHSSNSDVVPEEMQRTAPIVCLYPFFNVSHLWLILFQGLRDNPD